jgi:prevent-host-death family protein
MNVLNANDLKVGGVTAIETALQGELEVAISVRGERRFVVMSAAQYEHLRECELEAAWLASQADRTAGRAQKMSAAQHQLEMQNRLRKPAAALTAQQERAAYADKQNKITNRKKVAAAAAAPKTKPTSRKKTGAR